MKISSFNIWSDVPRNARWTARREAVADMREAVADILRSMAPDVAGLQEATLPMFAISKSGCRITAGSASDARMDTKRASSRRFFCNSEIRVIVHGRFWLSADCEKPARGWDAVHPRIVTWARFAHRESGRRFVHFNTHLDHLGRRARRGSALLLRQKIAAIAGAEPAVMTGDFNCQETSELYRLLTGQIPFPTTPDAPPGLRDTFHHAEQPREGEPSSVSSAGSVWGGSITFL